MPRTISIGDRVVKVFGDDIYIGEVIGHDREVETSRKLYRVRYTDGDEEDLYARELWPLLSAESRIPRSDTAYQHRKSRENEEFMHDCHEFLPVPIPQCAMIALDDLAQTESGDAVANTLSTWTSYGGRADKVWIPNPDVNVVAAVHAQGGNARLCLFGQLLREMRRAKAATTAAAPRFDAAYLDLCGFFDTILPDVRYMLKHHQHFLADTVVLHLTTARREGVAPSRIATRLRSMCHHANYGDCRLVRHYTSKTMHKFAFVLQRRRVELRSRHVKKKE